MSRCVSPRIYPAWGSLCSLDLADYFLSHVREVFSYYLFKYFLRSFLSLFSFWGPYNANVYAFNVYIIRNLPRQLLPVPTTPALTPAAPCLHRRPSVSSRSFGFSFVWNHCFFPLSLGVGNVLFVPSKIRVSVSPSPMEVL